MIIVSKYRGKLSFFIFFIIFCSSSVINARPPLKGEMDTALNVWSSAKAKEFVVQTEEVNSIFDCNPYDSKKDVAGIVKNSLNIYDVDHNGIYDFILTRLGPPYGWISNDYSCRMVILNQKNTLWESFLLSIGQIGAMTELIKWQSDKLYLIDKDYKPIYSISTTECRKCFDEVIVPFVKKFPDANSSDLTDEIGKKCIKNMVKYSVNSKEFESREAPSKTELQAQKDAKIKIDKNSKLVFVTNATYDGNLKKAGGGATGLEGADNICNTVAKSAGLSGNWKAWISDSQTDAIDRIKEVGPWYLLDGNLVFKNKANFESVPISIIDISESGKTLDKEWVWTGTNIGGIKTEINCGNWAINSITENESNNGEGTVGTTGLKSYSWTQLSSDTCNKSNHLYCIQQ